MSPRFVTDFPLSSARIGCFEFEAINSFITFSDSISAFSFMSVLDEKIEVFKISLILKYV